MYFQFFLFKRRTLMILKWYIVVLFLSFSILSCESQDSSNKEAQLKELVERIWVDAVEGNLEALRELHLNSPKFSKFGPRVSTRQDVKSTNINETEHFSSIQDASFEIEDIKVDFFGDVAVTTFYNSYSYIKNELHIKGKARVTLVFISTEDGWKIVHEHTSPFSS